MTKKEIPTAKNNELIVDYVDSQIIWAFNSNGQGGTTRVAKHCHDLETELIKRGLLTQADVDHLNQ